MGVIAVSVVEGASGGGGVNGDVGMTGDGDMSRAMGFFMGSDVVGRVGDAADGFVGRSVFTKQMFSFEFLFQEKNSAYS